MFYFGAYKAKPPHPPHAPAHAATSSTCARTPLGLGWRLLLDEVEALLIHLFHDERRRLALLAEPRIALPVPVALAIAREVPLACAPNPVALGVGCERLQQRRKPGCKQGQQARVTGKGREDAQESTGKRGQQGSRTRYFRCSGTLSLAGPQPSALSTTGGRLNDAILPTSDSAISCSCSWVKKGE